MKAAISYEFGTPLVVEEIEVEAPDPPDFEQALRELAPASK